MRFKAGLLIGFAAGYYTGAMAGRERYEQINQMLAKVRRSDAFETVADQAQSTVDTAMDRATEVMGSSSGQDSSADRGTSAPQSSPEPASGVSGGTGTVAANGGGGDALL